MSFSYHQLTIKMKQITFIIHNWIIRSVYLSVNQKIKQEKSFEKTHKNTYRVVQSKVYDVIYRKSVYEILKYFLMESFSI